MIFTFLNKNKCPFCELFEKVFISYGKTKKEKYLVRIEPHYCGMCGKKIGKDLKNFYRELQGDRLQ